MSDQQALIDALSKRRSGQKLTQADARVIERYESSQRDKIGSEYVRNCPKGQIFEWSGRQPKQWLEWATRYGIPYKAGKDVPTVDLTAWVAWLAGFLSRNHDHLSQSGDPMGGSDSPALERWRAAKADLAEAERDEKRGIMISVDVIRDMHARMGSLLRHAGERIALYGEGPAEILNDALDGCDSILDEVIQARQRVNGNGATKHE